MATTNTLGIILIVDDDENISELLKYNLSSEGYGIIVVPLAKDVDFNEASTCRLAIVDAMSQSYSGIDLCADLKSNSSTATLPIIVCTEREGEDIIVDAFDHGAEDFVSKPFSLRELIARIRAVLRRHPMLAVVEKPVSNEIVLPDLHLVIDPSNQKVTVDEAVVALTKTEYAILEFLVNNRNSFFTRADICAQVWKDDMSGNIRIVDTNISRLRKKLGECGKYIINRYGMGYAFIDKLQNASDK